MLFEAISCDQIKYNYDMLTYGILMTFVILVILLIIMIWNNEKYDERIEVGYIFCTGLMTFILVGLSIWRHVVSHQLSWSCLQPSQSLLEAFYSK
ncbi:hypothetical protein KP791_000075 [Venturia canescens]|uniref:Uncharacterized protein n=1 Tax=Venturia canescens TaxID=32260 RepID=A0ACB9ZJN0_9HYME|nr:uncharacterized LOC122408213 [Venturia canescens]KAI5630588.1 hypothetical protein KP791_000075 [Venturia canescens]